MWKAIWSFIQILPTVVGLIKRLIAAYRERQYRKEKEKADKSHQKMEDAKTIEEIQDANKDVTANLP